MRSGWLGRLGSNPISIWLIKHVVSPLDRLVVRLFRGRVPQPSSVVLPTLLLTTRGRTTGEQRTVPLIYLRDGNRFVVANARPAGERRNPWVSNLRAAGNGRVMTRGRTAAVTARELKNEELERWWPRLCEVWPAFAEHYTATGERTVFVLEPIDDQGLGDHW